MFRLIVVWHGFFCFSYKRTLGIWSLFHQEIQASYKHIFLYLFSIVRDRYGLLRFCFSSRGNWNGRKLGEQCSAPCKWAQLILRIGEEARGYKQREEEFQGRRFGLGFTLLKCFFVLIYKLTLISCNVALQAVKANNWWHSSHLILSTSQCFIPIFVRWGNMGWEELLVGWGGKTSPLTKPHHCMLHQAALVLSLIPGGTRLDLGPPKSFQAGREDRHVPP